MIIRDEHPSEIEQIRLLTEAVFMPKGFSDGTEGILIGKLRDTGCLTLSLVAEELGEIRGHVAFSPVTITGQTEPFYGLGPIAVAGEHQGKGIGGALIHEGLSRIKSMGASGVVLTGDPKYYSRFGFSNKMGLTHAGTPDHCVMGFGFMGVFGGDITFHPAFG